MTGRHGRDVTGVLDSQAAADMAANRTAAAIEVLCSRLRRQELFEHPQVQSALGRLQDQIAEQLVYADHKPGRHRSTPSTPDARQIDDVSGLDQKPDPLSASTPAEFVQVLRKYKFWSGDPSWRTMAKNAKQKVVHSTMYAAMNSDALPKFEVMKAIIIGCGGGEDDVKAFASAWRRIGGLVSLAP